MSKDINGFFPIKILFLGTSNVGKTSLIKRLINREDYKIDILHDFTIVLDIYLKAFKIEGQLIKCELWDTPGILGSMIDNMLYIKFVNISIFVFDLSSKDSFSEMKTYFNKYKDLTNQLRLDNDAIIIANKLDKVKNRQVSFEEINDFSMKNNVNFYEISAKDNKTGYIKLLKCIQKLAQNFLIKNKIIRKNNFFDIIKYKYISIREKKAVMPSFIYRKVDVFVKTLYKLFPVEDYILQIINDINDFYKSNIFKKISINNIEDLKSNIYNLEKIRGKLIEVFKIVALKYNVSSQENYQGKKKQKTHEKNEKQKSLLESDVSNNELTLVLFIKSNSILRKSIHYCIHDYIINFMFDFNNEIILEKRLNMIIKEDNNEEELIFKYFCDIEKKKQIIKTLFNENYVKYFSSSELHQYYLFITNIHYLFDYLENLYSEKSLKIFYEKGENSLNILKEYISANNKEFEKIKNENIKKLSSYELEKSIFFYSKKSIKYFKYVLNMFNSKYLNDKEIIFDCIKIRLNLSIVYNLINKQYESSLYFYSSFLLILEYIKNKSKTKEKNKNDDKNNKENEIFDLFNKIKDKLYQNIEPFSYNNDQKLIKQIKRKIKYHLNNFIEFDLIYNQEREEIKINGQTKGGKNSSNKGDYDFFSFPSIILKIYKSLAETVQADEKLKTKIKLYEIYSDSLSYYKREQYNIFFRCLSQKYSKKDSLLSYDGKNITSLKIDDGKIENILTKYDFLPSDIAQLFNIIGIGLLLLFRRNTIKDDLNDKQINLFKTQKNLALNMFNAGLNEKLIIKANELDSSIEKKLNLEKKEKNYWLSLEKIRNCIRINITMLQLIKNNNEINKIIYLSNNYLYDSNDFPINYSLEKQKEFIKVIYIDSNDNKSNLNKNYSDKDNYNIVNIFPSIKNYLPCLKKDKEGAEYLNYYIKLDDNIDEFDLFNALMANSNNEAFNKSLDNFVTPQNFKEKFNEYFNNSIGEEKELFNNILNKENLGNINYWKKKFDNKQGKGFLFNPIYFNYISKYYNFNINLYSFSENENKNTLEFLKSISLGIGNKYNMDILCDKNINQAYKIVIPLINKDEIFKFDIRNLKTYLNNLLKRAQEYMKLYPSFSNLLLWTIINRINIYISNDVVFNELDNEIIQLYLDCMYKLGLYEQIIHFIEENINNVLKNDKKYYLILFKCYKRLCLYDNCIDTIKKYLYENNSLEKELNYEIVQEIKNLQENDFRYIYNYYKNLEKERPIIFIPPLMDEDLFQILNDKYKNFDGNIFNLEAQIFEEKIEINQKVKLKQRLEKLKEGNKFRILCIEGCGIKSLIQLLFLCEIENYLQKPVSQIFDCIVTSRDGLFICGLLTIQDEKGEVKYHANDVLKIFHEQKETIYNCNLQKELKINLLKKLFNLPEIVGNLYYYDERCQAMLKIGNNDLIIDLFENFIDININKIDIKNDSRISLNNILRIIPKNIKKDNLYFMNLGNGIYPFNNSVEDNISHEQSFLKQILGEHYLNLDIPLNTCKNEGKFSLQSLDNQFNQILMNAIEFFSEIKDNNILFTDKLDKFFMSNNS